MIKKIFWEDAYKKELKTKVSYANGNKIALEETIIYPFSGGQESDSAKINGLKVVEAKEDAKKKEIYYVLEKEPNFRKDDEIDSEIDWKKRYKTMKLHSAAHVIHELFSKVSGITETIGSNITSDKARLDYESENPVTEMLPKIEELANKIFSQDYPVEISETDGKRIWKAINAKIYCGGTHVKNLNEIEKINLKRKNIGKGKERIEITLSSGGN